MNPDFHIVSEVQLIYKTNKKIIHTITNSHHSEKIIRAAWDENTIEHIEEFKIILLNRANKVLGISTISKGGTTATVVDPKIVFQTALKANANSIILVHNHPSGNVRPSDQDRNITKNLVKGGKLLGINVIDHIIITKDSYYSFADERIM